MLDNIKSQFDLSFNVQILEINTDTDEVIKEVNRKNLVVTNGINLVRDLLNETAYVGLNYLAVGAGATAVSAADSTLGNEKYRGAFTKRTASSATLTLSYYLSSTQANGNSLTEAGLFGSSAGGVLFARVTHAAIVKSTGNAVIYNWTVNIGAS